MGYIQELRALVGHRPLIVVGTGVLLLREEQVLLQRRKDNGLWALPGGFLEPGESVEVAAQREALEEVGAVIHSMKLLNVYSGAEHFYQYPNGDQIYDVCVVFWSRDFDVTFEPERGEVLEIAYYPLEALPGQTNPLDRVIIEDFLRNPRQYL